MRAQPMAPEQPEQPEVPVWRPARKTARPPRKPPLTVDAIVDAALEIVDTEGLDALSMRGVAQKLGTGAASLYAHVANKEDLVDLVFDRVAGELRHPTPDPDRWEEQLRSGMRQVRDVFAAHRDLAQASFGRIPVLPNGLRSMEGMMAILKASGLPDKVIAWSADLLALYATSAAYEQGLLALRESREPGSVERYFGELGAFLGNLPPAHFPATTSLFGAMADGDGDERFDFGLDVIILGMKAYGERMRAEEADERPAHPPQDA